MPLIMQRICQITGNYTPEEKEKLLDMISDFRVRMSDDIPEKNLLNNKLPQYTDDKIIKFFKMALSDINSGVPKTRFTIFNLYDKDESDLIIEGSMIFALIGEGILQLRNQMDYSDSGLSISMFNKTGAYQSWAGVMISQYVSDKATFKSSIIPRSHNSGFVGVSSEFGYRWGGRY
jgi:hypothetical protein